VTEEETVVELRMDPVSWLRKQLETTDVDLLQEMVRAFAETLMSAEVDALCGVSYGERSEGRVNRRNGYRERDFDTRAGTIELRVPKLRQGSCYPDWLFERRRRAGKALVAVICECHVRGISTRRVDGLVKALGMEGISKTRYRRWLRPGTPKWPPFALGPWTAAPIPTCGWTLFR
jgi:transposase-like protein